MCVLQIIQQAHRMAGHTAAVTGKTQMFFGGRFYIDLAYIQAEYACNVFPHLGNMILQLGALGNHGHVDIRNFEARLFHFLTDNFQQF